MTIDPEFLADLRCPVSGARLFADGGRLIAADPRGRRAYRVEDGAVPILLAEEAESLDETAWRESAARAGEPAA